MAILVKRDPPISWVIIDKQDKGNSLDYEEARLLASKIKEECEVKDTSVVVIRGAGNKFFSAGVDLTSVAKIKDEGDAWKLMYEGLGGVCEAVYNCEKPVIAAVNGHAVGIGFEILYHADIVVAVKNAKLGSPAVRWGMVPPATPTIGPLLLGYKNAAYIALTGRLLEAQEARRMGIVNFVVEDEEELIEKVKEIASDIANNDQWAVRSIKRLLRGARPSVLLERGLMSLVYSAARKETRERARGFVERKKKQ
ncbi:MAG: enoyl-CoA hydratase/isomerase family protein [Desulfurococcales archaeon]|nr:enoyl-CoA hydratase/isomerase family protein [Desulfurococcales archaeon]